MAGRPRKLTAEQEAQIWSQYQDGISIKLIAAAMGLSYQLVYLSIKRERDNSLPAVHTDVPSNEAST